MNFYTILAIALLFTQTTWAQNKADSDSFKPFDPETFISTTILTKAKTFKGSKLDKILYGVSLYLENAELISRKNPNRIAKMGIVDFQNQLFHSLPLGKNHFYTVVLNALNLLKNNELEIRKHSKLKNACRWGYIAWVDVMQIQKEKKDILNICASKVTSSEISLETSIETILHELLHLSGLKAEGDTKRVESIIVALAGELPFITYVRNNEYHPFLDNTLLPVTQNCLNLEDFKKIEQCLLFESIIKSDYSKLIGLENKKPDVLLYHRLREAVLFNDVELAKSLVSNNKNLMFKMIQYIDPKGKTLIEYSSSRKMKDVLDVAPWPSI